MLRFCDKYEMTSDILHIVVVEKGVFFDEAIWRNGKEFFRSNLKEQGRDLKVFPVLDVNGEVVCYGWQDGEANRELRMIRELEDNSSLLQFCDIFPDVREVLVCGCNELAYSFVKYLEHQGVEVSVTGRYWKYLGYKDREGTVSGKGKRLVLYAERESGRTGELYDLVAESASDEFECVNQIYEENVVNGRIKDASGDISTLIDKIRGKDVYLMGINQAAQDMYDMLYTYGIDISGFIYGVNKGESEFFLGKRVIGRRQLMHRRRNVALINCTEEHSTLDSESADYFDYYGYRRNEQFFLARDYTDIPCTNLIHVLKGKKVLLAGDSRLCTIVKSYLDEVGKGDIDVHCGELSQCLQMDERDVFCAVNLWYCIKNKNTNKKERNFTEELSHIGAIIFTNYFSSLKVLVTVEQYRNRNIEKYSLEKLMPRGILLGAILSHSGNALFKGILDGHPEVLEMLPFSSWDDNLFLYCIRLAGERAENILAILMEMLIDEIGEISAVFPDWDRFANSAEALLTQKERFTSQELFLLFRIAYAEMMRGEGIADISEKVIYWEPHMVPREEISMLAQWLESEKMQGLTVVMSRNQVMRTGSYIKGEKSLGGNCFLPRWMMADEWMTREETVPYQHWQKIAIRFEDLKLHPGAELLKVCGILGITWSDTMLRTTYSGKAQNYLGTQDFDLKPVFHQYEEYLSEFDRFRISILSAPYQKKYGYPYVDCRIFSRRELWTMFLKEFRFQENMPCVGERDRKRYIVGLHWLFRRQLWKVRTYAVRDNITPEFEPVEMGESALGKREIQRQQAGLVPQAMAVSEQQKIEREKAGKILTFVRSQEKLILYGIGKDCNGLLKRLGTGYQGKFLYCDKKAAQGECVFRGQRVLSPRELCESYRDYKILITSSMYSTLIRWELEDMGVSPDRITCNIVRLWDERDSV